MPQRRSIPVRMGQAGIDWCDRIAASTNSSRSEVMRAALKVAAAHEKDLLKLLNEQDTW